MNQENIQNSVNRIGSIYGVQTSNQIKANLREINLIHDNIMKTHSEAIDISDANSMDNLILSKRSLTLNDIIDDTLSDRPSSNRKRLLTPTGSVLSIMDSSFSDVPTHSSLIKFKSSTKRSSKILSRLGGMQVGTNSKWSPGEKHLFYQGLRFFGTDFAMISSVQVRTKSRNQILNFFKSEDKKDQAKIDQALLWNRLSLSHRQNHFNIDQQIADTIESCNLTAEQDPTCSDCFMIKQNVNMNFQVPKPLALPS
jgi:hypothetical protein